MRIAGFGPLWRYVVNFIHANGRPNTNLPAIPFWRWKQALRTAREMANHPAMEGAIIEIYARKGWRRELEDKPRDRFYGRKVRAYAARDALVRERPACPNKYCKHAHCEEIRGLTKIIGDR